MWVCPKCGREFGRTNQGHYCGKAPETVSEYIQSQPPEARSYLSRIMNTILSGVPDVKERISWSMPTYEKSGKSVSFAACKRHVSLYVGAGAIEKFASELRGLTTRKSALYLPYDRVLPEKLIEDIVKWCLN